MEAAFYDKIAFSLAQEVGFECFRQRTGEYAFRKRGAGCMSPCLYGRSAGPNPCGEVPLEYYEVTVEIEGTKLTINGKIAFDLNDPDSIDQFKVEFRDLDALRQKIENLRNGLPATGKVYFDFTEMEADQRLKQHAKARMGHYDRERRTW